MNWIKQNLSQRNKGKDSTGVEFVCPDISCGETQNNPDEIIRIGFTINENGEIQEIEESESMLSESENSELDEDDNKAIERVFFLEDLLKKANGKYRNDTRNSEESIFGM